MQLGRFEQVLPNVLRREVVHGRQAGLAQHHGTLAIGDGLAVERHPHSARERLDVHPVLFAAWGCILLLTVFLTR